MSRAPETSSSNGYCPVPVLVDDVVSDWASAPDPMRPGSVSCPCPLGVGTVFSDSPKVGEYGSARFKSMMSSGLRPIPDR